MAGKSLKRKFEFPNTYVIVFSVILLCAVATWFVPGGEYVHGEGGGMTYTSVESVPQTWQVLTALYRGFEKQAGIIVFILVVGGALWIINSTKALDAGIAAFLEKARKLERFAIFRALGVNNIVLVSMTLLFSLFGSVHRRHRVGNHNNPAGRKKHRHDSAFHGVRA